MGSQLFDREPRFQNVFNHLFPCTPKLDKLPLFKACEGVLSGAYLAYVSIKTTSVTQKKGDLGNFNMCPT